MNKYTRGPWKAGRLPARVGDGFGYGGESTVILGDGLVIILESGREADAKLIAAAPDLLEALKDILEYTSEMDGHEDWPPLRSAARAAIVKAKGGL